MKIEELINEVDDQGVPYFNEEERKKLLQEWNEIPESVMGFSVADFKNTERIEMDRLLSFIKDTGLRHAVEKDAERWALRNRRPAIEYVEDYIDNQRNLGSQMIREHVLDLTKGKEQLDESFLRQFGWLIQKVLERMFGHSRVPVRVKGSKEQIKALSQALASEKEYMMKFRDLGLDNPQTFRSKAKLKTAIDQFERSTGLKWPFGDKK